ncbi:hypothetical protein SISNIDRAFT_357307 [Sistotremastrum niveocremeum HHB9708]|uniref:Uncharacterized protein n=2 Tax=Sistotremastraceae TaxID=3402574 RepID=A0A164WJL0_9AGAM|nr:hypothetical protein SISNIDRAFT_357307 [Sistotremastrum niveocremeum HHB9708]KZT34631.1 hypothetical protein SISSUDRAFT_256293 [Sistotremastrum suecicum HHB10207 ss-3]
MKTLKRSIGLSGDLSRSTIPSSLSIVVQASRPSSIPCAIFSMRRLYPIKPSTDDEEVPLSASRRLFLTQWISGFSSAFTNFLLINSCSCHSPHPLSLHFLHRQSAGDNNVLAHLARLTSTTAYHYSMIAVKIRRSLHSVSKRYLRALPDQIKCTFTIRL